MPKALLNIRTFVGCFVALLQIFLLPATQVLHLSCQHEHVPPADSSVFETLEDVWASCWSSHCCDHGDDSGSIVRKNVDGQNPREPERSPVETPHEEDSCPVCQTVLASQIGPSGPVDLLFSRATCECLVAYSPIPREFPRRVVLDRGPPLTARG